MSIPQKMKKNFNAKKYKMKTKELIELLETCNEEAEVLFSQNGVPSMIIDVDQLGDDIVLLNNRQDHEATVIDTDCLDEVLNPSIDFELMPITLSVNKRVMTVYTSEANIEAIKFDKKQINQN